VSNKRRQHLAEWQIKSDPAETPEALNKLMDDVRGLQNGSKENIGRLWLKTARRTDGHQGADKMFVAPWLNQRLT
jgi:hypothetical protein